MPEALDTDMRASLINCKIQVPRLLGLVFSLVLRGRARLAAAPAADTPKSLDGSQDRALQDLNLSAITAYSCFMLT